jgi:hypothetical protein
MSPAAGAAGLEVFGKMFGKHRGAPDQNRGEPLLLGFPGFDNILLSFIAKGGNSRLLGYFGAFFKGNRYELSIRFLTILYSNGFEALETAERRTDVSFAASSNNTGHPGNIGHVGHRGGREGHDCHGHGYN